MLLMAFIQWWYGPGWAHQVKAISLRVRSISEMFSISILLRTLFAPWKQIKTSVRADQAVGIKFRAAIDNLVSRFVGLMVRSIVLFVATISITVVSVFSLILAIVWPALPILVILVIPLGVVL